MSSDNFYIVKGNKVFQGDMSDFCYAQIQAIAKFERRYFDRMARKKPYHVAESHEAAVEWAHNEYSEYGVMDEVEE